MVYSISPAGKTQLFFYVDAVAGADGSELDTDDWGIDLCLLGSQKCFSAPPGLGMVAVSERAWAQIDRTGYQGYDALAPFRDALARIFADRPLPRQGTAL